MPKGPNGQKRPADTIGCAVLVGKIATGEVEEAPIAPRGAAGGKARAEALTPSKRSEIASLAAVKRWQERKEDDDMQTAKSETVARGREAVCMYPNNSLRDPVRPYQNLVAELVKSSFTK
jgi:hypothetical protein